MEAMKEAGRGIQDQSVREERVPWWVNLVILLAVTGLATAIAWGILIRLGYLPE